MKDTLIGKVFGRLTVISEAYKREGGDRYYVLTQCSCGNKKEIMKSSLTKKKHPTLSCGCLSREIKTKYKEEDFINRKINRLTIIKDLGNIRKAGGRVYRFVECLCDCGTITQPRLSAVITGVIKSCGCIQKEVTINRVTSHGMVKSREYQCWSAMKQRCDNPKNTLYSLYGGRGISYDPRWESFENFYEDMGVCPEDMSLDRIDVDGDYSKENCRWTNNTVQMHNRRKQKSSGGKPSTSVFKGVSWSKSKNKWVCVMNYKHRNVIRKYFINEIDAAEAYDEQSLKYYGDEPNKELIKEYIENGKC